MKRYRHGNYMNGDIAKTGDKSGEIPKTGDKSLLRCVF